MPDKWSGTVDDRYARLDLAGKRCDGNSRRCVHSATESYQLKPARDWQPIPGGEPVTKQSCSRHRQQFINNDSYVVVSTSPLSARSPRKPHPHTDF